MRSPHFLGISLWLLLLGIAPEAKAHRLDVTTAKIVLRDDHVEVFTELDLMSLLDESPTTVATAKEETLQLYVDTAKKLLQEQTVLEADGVRLGLVLPEFPSAPEVRAMAATLSAEGKEHGTLVRLRLVAPKSLTGAKSLSLSLPNQVGPAVLSMVQPITRYAHVGSKIPFEILVPPSEIHSAVGLAAKNPVPLPPTQGQWRFLSAVFVLVAGFVVFFRKTKEA